MKWQDIVKLDEAGISRVLLAAIAVVVVGALVAGCGRLSSKFSIVPLQWEMGLSPPETQLNLSQQAPHLPPPVRESSNGAVARQWGKP